MRDYKVELPPLSRISNEQKNPSERLGQAASGKKLLRQLGTALLILLASLVLAGCGEYVKPTISPQNAALNFFHFLSSGASNNAETYWLPGQLTDNNRAQLAAAAANLRIPKLRNPQAEVNPTPLPITPIPSSDMGATVAVTVTAELQATDGTWSSPKPVISMKLASTSIGWRVLEFTLLDMSTKEGGDY